MRQQSTAGHLQATVLSKTRVDLQLNKQVRRDMELHNEKVKKIGKSWASGNFHFGDTMKALDPNTEETMWSFFLSLLIEQPRLIFLEIARNATGQARLLALASTAIEQVSLIGLKRTDNLPDRLIELFLRNERRMDLVSK